MLFVVVIIPQGLLCPGFVNTGGVFDSNPGRDHEFMSAKACFPSRRSSTTIEFMKSIILYCKYMYYNFKIKF